MAKPGNLRDWLLFAAAAIVPAILVGALGLRAVSNEDAAQRRARADELRREATSVRDTLQAELDVAAAVLDDVSANSTDRGPGEDEIARGAYTRLSARPLYGPEPMILSADGRILEPQPSASAVPARRNADDPCNAFVANGDKAQLLARCEDLITTTGRHLWLSLALEALLEKPFDAELVARISRWIGAHSADLRDSERVGAVDELDRLRGVAPDVRRDLIAAFQGATDVDELASVLRSDAAIRALRSGRGTQRFASKGGLGVVRPIGRGMVGAFLLTPSSVARALAWKRSEALGVDVAATAVTSAANVDPDREAVAWLSDGLGVRAAPRDPSGDAARAGTRKVVIGVAAAVGAFIAAALATILFARMRAARRTSELRTSFVAAVSHELRTPIASVRMLAELLEEGRVDPSEVKEVHEALTKEAKRLGDTVDRLLGFSRLAAGKLTLERRVQPVAAPVARAVAAFRERRAGALPEKVGKDVEDAVEDIVEEALDADATSDIDAGQIEIIVTNLLENALKYAPGGKPYRVSVRREAGAVLLSVRDRGPGIAAKHHARIFEPFERVDDRLSKATEGSGIGLSLVRQIARAHGGDAWVESEPGAGATFVVRLPEIAAAAEQTMTTDETETTETTER
ncbi:MAG: HAMP domain-containing sensor histidine kinase [Polyangiaceae bacterium]